MDGIQLEILWSNLLSIVSEQGRALQRNAFSPIVREAGDLAAARVRRQGPHAGAGGDRHARAHQLISNTAQLFAKRYPPERLAPGDCDHRQRPLGGGGHFFDITMFTPVYRKGAIIAFFGCTVHHTDIGGYGLGAGARDVHEEGCGSP